MIAVDVPGARLAVTDRGTGMPIVLVHGGTGTGAHDWANIVDQLFARYRTIVVDLRGHGGSSLEDGDVSMRRFGLDLLHVARRLGIGRAVWMGFSVGANTLLTLLADHPHLARAIVCIGGSARGDASRVRRILSGPWPAFLTGLEHVAANGQPDYWMHLRARLAEDWAANLDLDDAKLARLDCPVLIVHGDDDRIQRLEEALHLYRLLREAHLFVVPGAGHGVQFDQPELLLQGLAWFLDHVVAAHDHRRTSWTSP